LNNETPPLHNIVTERRDEGVARIKELTKGTGADSVLEGSCEFLLRRLAC
jgi:hypothetical protein